MIFERPMLAPRESPLSYPEYYEKLRYPLLISDKLDGVRGIVLRDTVYSRSMKVLPSFQVQDEFGKHNYVDGEIIVGDPQISPVLNRTIKYVRAFNVPADDLRYYVFDIIDMPTTPFYRRLEILKERIEGTNLRYVEHTLVENYEELVIARDKAIAAGFEGLMMRDPIGPYRQKRCTFKQGWLYKLKMFEDAEGIVVDIYEKETNTNEKVVNEIGLTSRSSSKEGKVKAGTLGGFIVDYNGIELRVAPGNFDDAQKQKIFDSPEKEALGKLLKFKWMKYGMKDVPRFCSAIEFRDDFDK